MDDNRIAMIAIVVENPESTHALNDVLHEYAPYIIGRMGVPYHKRNIALISIAIDAPSEVISALTGKLGNIEGLNVKTAYSKI